MKSPKKAFVAKLTAMPETRDRLIELQTELKRLVFEQEPDALVYEVLQSQTDPNVVVCVATFRDDAAFEHHMHVDFHDRLVPPILATLAKEMELEFYVSLA